MTFDLTEEEQRDVLAKWESSKASAMLFELERDLARMRNDKPTDRSERARCWAIAITEMEKLVAFFKVYVVKDA